jgi:hypothetical protein
MAGAWPFRSASQHVRWVPGGLSRRILPLPPREPRQRDAAGDVALQEEKGEDDGDRGERRGGHHRLFEGARDAATSRGAAP